MDRGLKQKVELTDEALQALVAALGEAVQPRVLYRPDQQQMTEEALEICQKQARAALRLLSDALPADHWLAEEIGALLGEAVEVWERYPF